MNKLCRGGSARRDRSGSCFFGPPPALCRRFKDWLSYGDNHYRESEVRLGINGNSSSGGNLLDVGHHWVRRRALRLVVLVAAPSAVEAGLRGRVVRSARAWRSGMIRLADIQSSDPS